LKFNFTFIATLLTFALLTLTLATAIPNHLIPEIDNNLPHSPETATETEYNGLLGNSLLTRGILSAHKMITSWISGRYNCNNCDIDPAEPPCSWAGDLRAHSLLALVGGLVRMGVLL
jgi:hypothetical protein